jgi:hypothetical protein
MRLCAIFKGVSETIGIDRLAKVLKFRNHWKRKAIYGNKATDEKLWVKLWFSLKGVLSTVKKLNWKKIKFYE